ncbi:rhomboid-related protein 4-like isoform X2 [Lytechinus variegatus]|uniref:rhomboid-related protein 4-like isoform X2 n=1 Tax=Lytechinus variegatus TaxID=7654 RepID=UPI001BB1EE64|nr:rhomboid-related protein 4-like isoform X2 [Lytechinus variegatus]
MFQPRRRGMGRQQGLGLLLLFHQLYRVGFNRIPPVTMATIAANVLIFLRVLNPYIKSAIRSPSISNICVSSAHVWYKGDWPRLFLAAWFHLDDWHLYYNMVSFIWKGITLERKFGSPYFAYLIVMFCVLTNGLLVALNVGIAELLEDSSHIVSCAAGFSGVLFALKVLTTYYTPVQNQRIMGMFSVPSRWACWVELILIQLIVPRASFTGHLAGILVGMAYVKGPLKILMDALWSLFASVLSGDAGQGPRYQPRTAATGLRDEAPTSRSNQSYAGRGYSTGSGSGAARSRPSPTDYPYDSSTGSSSGGTGASPTLPNYQPDDYTGGLSEEEQMRTAMRQSMNNGYPSPPEGGRAMPSAPPSEDHTPHLYPDLSRDNAAPPPPNRQNGMHASGISAEELRRRRLDRLDR